MMKNGMNLLTFINYYLELVKKVWSGRSSRNMERKGKRERQLGGERERRKESDSLN